MPIDYSAVIEEFMKYELDPARLKESNIYGKLLMVRENMDLSSTARAKAADGFVAGAIAVIATKAGTCKYWERKLKEEVKHLRIGKRIHYKTVLPDGIARMSKQYNDWLDEQVSADAEVIECEKKQALAESSRAYWEFLLEALKEMGKRIDSAGMLTAVEEKRNPPVGLGS
jgi:hypothetical protein